MISAGWLPSRSVLSRRAWTPRDFGADLVAWYDASDATTVHQSGGAVSQWDDKSGNGYHLLQGTGSRQPLYSATGFQSSAPGITFDGVDDFMEVANVAMGTDRFAALAFAQMDVAATPFAVLLRFIGANHVSDGASNGSAILLEANATPNKLEGFRRGETSQIGVWAERYYNMESSWDGTNNTVRVIPAHKDAYALVPVPVASAGPLDVTGTLRLGAHSIGAGLYWKGAVSEIILLKRAPTAGERAQLDNYFLRPWTRVLIVEGDSLSYNYPYKFLPNANPPVFLRNMTVGGSRLAVNQASGDYPGDLAFRASTWVDPLLLADRGGRQNVFFVNIGANGIEGGGTAFALAVAAYARARPANKRVMATLLSRTDELADDTNRQIFNSTITTPGWAAAHGIDAVCDFASDAIMGVDQAPSVNPTYFVDAVHPSEAGYVRMEAIFRACINGL